MDYRFLQPTNTPTPGSGSPSSSTDSTASSTGNNNWRICSVLCLHDFVSDDPSHLSFARNEILEIVQQEDTGWWAALRLEGNRVGWISRSVSVVTSRDDGLCSLSAFVEPLSDELAERLRTIPEPLRALEYDDEILSDSHSLNSHIPEHTDPVSPLSEVLAGYESSWLPNIEEVS
jgi:son of sevenless-like protein